ncbi:MAG TPA: SdrD B-like domain-containing protein [Pyrinomonadaceae bacterium]
MIAAILVAVICASTATGLARLTDDPTEAGAAISNRAEATYVDEDGASFSTVSPTVTVTVLAVSTLNVTPDETEPSTSVAPNERITRLFNICNTGNTPDFYTITRAEVSAPARLFSLHFDADSSGTLTDSDPLIQIGASLSPRLTPGRCINVIATIDTADVAPNSRLTINLTARSNVTQSVNGLAQNDGTIINAVGNGARLTDPANPNLPPLKLVENSERVSASPGQTLLYTIAFRNNGDVAARRVTIVDELPSGLEYMPGTLRLGQRALTDAADADEGSVNGNRIELLLETVAPNEVVQIALRARVTGQIAPGAGAINYATIAGENAPVARSSSALAVVDPFGTVYNGHSGGSQSIAGARLTIFADQPNGTPLALTQGIGFAPNEANENPYTTLAGGHFSFMLTPEQAGTPTAPARYYLNVTAQSYRQRMLELSLRPAGNGLYTSTVRALDGQPISRSGSFEVTNDSVLLENLASLALNVPMFEQRGLEISKSTDRQRVEIGDAITYRIEVHNPSAAVVSDAIVRDHLPVSFHYVSGTAQLQNGAGLKRAIEPETQGEELVFHLGELGAGANARLLYRVRVGANAGEGERENTAIAVGIFPSGERDQTAPARATVFVGGGVFSTRQVIVGRVFEDANNNGQFDDEDSPLPGVRLFLNNGQSVVTDSAGLYNFPSLGDGALVLALDSVTLPSGYQLTDGGALSGRSWTRLLRTPLGGGALLRQNFALVKKDGSSASRPASSSNAYPVSSALAASDNSSARSNNSSGESDKRQAATVNQPAGATTNKTSGTTKASEGAKASEVAKATEAPLAAGTYEVAATETLEPIAPGEVRVLSPAANAVVMSPAMQLEARVALEWSIRLEVNGERVSDRSIGTSRLDQKNRLATYTYVGINLRPGPNRVTVTAISPAGVAGRTEELSVMGRGPARRIEIAAEKTEIQADGRDASLVRVRAFDEWGNPAADGSLGIETSTGSLQRLDDPKTTAGASAKREASGVDKRDASGIEIMPGESANQPNTQVVVPLTNGEAVVKLTAAGSPGEARLRAQLGDEEARTSVRITPESRPTILVGLADVSVGKGIPEVALRGEQGNVRSRLSFFYSGPVFSSRNMLTLAYDSQRPLNRTAGRDRLFQLDPLDRAYPLFGDSSTRLESAQSNSKLYARLDRGRSYAMFGDFEADMDDLSLAGYSRKLTGVKLHLENSQGDFVTVTGARPDTSFARDVFPAGSLGLLRLSRTDILPGSESIVLEVRDRRNPEIILSRETLVRSVDYNLNPATGELFFLRYISTFDYALNLAQIVATYEHRATDMTSAVYTARAEKNFSKLGLRLGLSAISQRQSDLGSFMLGGLDGEKSLPRKGALRFAWARSHGEIMGGGNFFETGDGKHNGDAYMLELDQPLSYKQATLRARYSSAASGFLNPFGATVTPGARRGEVSFEFKPLAGSLLQFGMTTERNRTALVDNSRLTYSASWDQTINERVRFHLGYDHRSFSDDLSQRSTESNLVTAAVEAQVTDKLNVTVKREQNLGEPDPTYPNQTTLAANYTVNQLTRIFFTQRLASAPITPIGDYSNTGFAATSARRETAFGVETRFGKYTSATGRYQLENGATGTDSFAVVGLQNRIPVSDTLALEVGFERGFHLAGDGESFNSLTGGFAWTPVEDFRATARYEFRDRNGLGQLLAFGAAGRIRPGLTTMARLQYARGNFGGRNGSSLDGMAAIALRPLSTDRVGLLFSYNHRSIFQDDNDNATLPLRDRIDSLSADGYFQATSALELYGRFALRLNANGQPDLPYVSTLTYLTQGRVQYRLTRRFDWAVEARLLMQPSSGTQRAVYGTELGFWVMPDLRVGGGYNFTRAGEPAGARTGLPARRGFYFTISSKLSNLFDLFGTSKQGLANDSKVGPQRGENR